MRKIVNLISLTGFVLVYCPWFLYTAFDAYWSACSLPVIPICANICYYFIRIVLLKTLHSHFIIRIAKTCPGHGSSNCIHFKYVCASAKIVTAVTSCVPQISSIILILSHIAYISTSNTSFCWLICTLLFCHFSTFHATAHSTHSFSFLDLSVQRTKPSVALLSCSLACSSSWILSWPPRLCQLFSKVAYSQWLFLRNSPRINSIISSTLCAIWHSCLIIYPHVEY